jgi:prepilin-type N-terminal cleavage/methylation domain-containing protein
MTTQRLRPTGGFTLLELVVALFIGAVVVVGGRLILESLSTSERRLRRTATSADRIANGDNLLRQLFGRLEVGTPYARTFAGYEREVRFVTWCDVPAGWLERCHADVAIDRDSEGGVLVVHFSTGERIVLQSGFRAGAFRYLNSPADGGQWFAVWGSGMTAPLAISIITDRDTTMVRIGARG